MGVEAEEEVAAFVVLPVVPLVPLFEVTLQHCIQFLHEARVNVTENGPPDDCSVGFTIAEVGIVEVGIVEIGIAQVSIAQVGFAEIRLYVLMLLSPGVPGIYAMLKKVEMLLTCHHVLLACSALIINKRSLIRKSRFLGLPGRFAVHGTA